MCIFTILGTALTYDYHLLLTCIYLLCHINFVAKLFRLIVLPDAIGLNTKSSVIISSSKTPQGHYTLVKNILLLHLILMQLFRPTNLWDGFAAFDFSNTGCDKG